jgi:c-di-GMP-related signal transduction protein
MIDLKKVHEMWQNDSIINNAKLDETSKNTPQLHAKYLQLWSTAKLELRRAEFEQKKLLKDKWLYYNGKMDHRAIKEKGWVPDPFDGLKVLKGEMDYYYDSDPEIQKSEERIQYWKTVVDTLSEIIDSLKWRHQTIGNIIKWKQFESGN